MGTNYDCCTHYQTDEYDDGHVMFPFFSVKVCRNCGEVIAKFGPVRNFLFDYIFSLFWDGKVHIYQDQEREDGMERYTEKVDGIWVVSCKYEEPPYPVVTQDVIDRLASYEDTGLEPEEIIELKARMEGLEK